MLKIFLVIALLLGLLGGGFFFFTNNRSFVWPMRVVGGNPGNYTDGEYVLVGSPKAFNFDYKKGDVVIFDVPKYEPNNQITIQEGTEMVGELIGLDGDAVNDTTTYYSNDYIKGQVPAGHFLVQLNKGIYWRVIPKNAVLGKVIYPKK